MRNKYAPKRGGNTGRNTSSRGTPKKDNKPDKSKGLENHIFSSGRSEDFQKIYEYLMSYIRLNYDNGDDIATAIENGKPYDFDKEMPSMQTPTPPTDPNKQQEHTMSANAPWEIAKCTVQQVHWECAATYVLKQTCPAKGTV